MARISTAAGCTRSWAYWESADTEGSDVLADYARLWQSADKVVYSRTLEPQRSARTRIERTFDPDAVRALKDDATANLSVGGPELAAAAFAAGLVDECHFFLAPVVVGGGTQALPRARASSSSRWTSGGSAGARSTSTTQSSERMSLTQYYTATTLDGFIADENHSLEWLFTRDQDRSGPGSYADFIANVGALAMGSTTYEWILDHEFAGKDPSEWKWPYDIPCWVFTSRKLTEVPGAQIEFVSGEVATVHEEMVRAADSRNLWIVGGGDLVGQFADVGLLDEVWVSIACVTLGAGAPLLPRRLELAVEDVARNGDFIAARFRVVGPLP